MRKIAFIGLTLVILIGLATTAILDARAPRYYSGENIKTDVKKIDNGIQITITSDDPEITKEIQENAGWYEESFKYGYWDCPHYRARYGYRQGCGDSLR